MNKIISPDALLMEDGKYVWTPPRVEAAHRTCREEFLQALQDPEKIPARVILLVGAPGSGKSTWANALPDENALIFDATLNSWPSRKILIEGARKEGFVVEVVTFLTPLSLCLKRNAARSEDRRVPTTVIENMHKKIRRAPPSPLSEKFHTLTYIRTSEEGEVKTLLVTPQKYRPRGFPCTIVAEEKLWAVTGSYLTENGEGGGVLEWCYDKKDALTVLREIERDAAYDNLKVGRYLPIG